ncbi:MAG TPA: hypothetical protein VJP02_17440 [Candidatus Sulfotelmatobacter sp.]|nr:hypothetical protein [Candidatus Sulfotelmatobacter sp.]
MPIPTFHFSISGSVLALYGAVLSTITATAQFFVHYRDRANIKIRVQPNMETMGDPRTDGMTFTIVFVSNAGRRPVTITSVGAYRLYPRRAFVCPDTRPRVPHELTEGKQMMAMIDQSDLDVSVVEYWAVGSATGREYRLNVAPWYKRWLSSRKRLRKARRELKERLAKEAKSTVVRVGESDGSV